MKLKILLLFLFLPSLTMAQQTITQDAPNTLRNFKGGVKIDSVISIPIRDTISWNGIKSDFVRRNDVLYYYNGAKYNALGNMFINQVNGLQDSLNKKVAYTDTTTVIATKSNVNAINVNSIVFTGSATKTLTITKGNGIQVIGSFTDNDNQTLSLSSNDTLSIAGGNSIHLPYLRSVPVPSYQSFTGLATNTLGLSNIPSSTSTVKVFMNNAFVDPVDWTRSGSTINLSFTTSTSDLITIYYSY